MKKSTIILFVLALTLSVNVEAQLQIGSATPNGVSKPRKDREVIYSENVFALLGGKSQTFILVTQHSEFKEFVFTIRKTHGNAKASFKVFTGDKIIESWSFDGKTAKEEKTIKLSNISGKKVSIRIKNDSKTEKLIGNFETVVLTNSMLNANLSVYPAISNTTLTKKIETIVTYTLNTPQNGKGTIDIVRLNGNASAEIVITKGDIVLKTETLASNQTSRRINLTNIPQNDGWFRVVIRKNESNKLLRTRTGAWFN